MNSKIPKSKAEKRRDQPTETPTPCGEILDDRAAHVLSSLHALGAPQLNQQEFSSVFSGPFADVLLFISEHMKGRKEVARMRGEIHSMREERKKLNIRRPDDALRSVADKAASALSAARKTAEVCRRQVDEKTASIEVARHEIEAKQLDLHRKRKISMMLEVFERRESLRVKRFEELGRLLVDLRTAVLDSKPPVQQADSLPTTLSGDVSVKFPRTPTSLMSPRTSHTRETLANWYAYHIRLSRLVQDRNSRQTEADLALRLREAVLSCQPGCDPDAMIQKIIAVARVLGKQKTRNQSQLASRPRVTKANLQEREEGNKAKAQEIQMLLNESTALAFVSDHYIRVISTFIETTSHIVRSSLEEGGSKTDGFVDKLRCLISAPPSGSEDEHRREFALSVRRTIGIRGNINTLAVVKEVEKLIRKRHKLELFLRSANIAEIPSKRSDELLLDNHHADTKKSQERASKLLSRKVEKAEVGLSIVRDIEDLMRETRTIVGREL